MSDSKLSQYVIDNNIKKIKKFASKELSGTNQFGETYYEVAKRLGYKKLADYLYEHTNKELIIDSSKVSPVELLSNNLYMPEESKIVIQKMLEAYAFHPVLSKMLIPLALENVDKKYFGIVLIEPQWKFGLSQLGMDEVSYMNMESFKKDNICRDISNRVCNTFKDIDSKTSLSTAMFITKLEDRSYYSLKSLIIHEIEHGTIGHVFKGKTSVPYSDNYGEKCSKKTYEKAFNEFEQNVKFLLSDNIGKSGVSVTKDKGKEIVKVKNEQGKEIDFTIKSLDKVYHYSKYDSQKHEEAIVVYPSLLGENIPEHHTTFIKPLSDYTHSCIIPAIEEFASHHQNCHLLQGLNNCFDQQMTIEL